VCSYGLKQRQQSKHVLRTDRTHTEEPGPADPLANNRENLLGARSAVTGIYRQNTKSTDRQIPTPESTNSVPSTYHPNLFRPGSVSLRDISKALTNLSKLYSDDKLKFRGDKY
jgi:hypothetical protein